MSDDIEATVPDDPTIEDALAGALTTWRFFDQADVDDAEQQGMIDEHAETARVLYYGLSTDSPDEGWATDEDEDWKDKPLEDADNVTPPR